jgi:purine-binding chemotaxis protein CheW
MAQGVQDAEIASLVVFTLGETECALDVSEVAEILRMVALSPVPESPYWLAGCMNLRSDITPVIDLRVRMGIEAAPITASTPILVVGADHFRAGLIIDSVTELLDLPRANIQMPRHPADDSPHIKHIARDAERIIIVLDLTSVTDGALIDA